MKTREVTLASGESFVVPQGIQRLDSKSTKGWQVRYQGTKYFPDKKVGPAAALETASKELFKRIATLPAPVVLKRAPSPRKTSTLPPGISGPILVKRSKSAEPAAVLSVLVPRHGATNTIRTIHIGTRSNYSTTRFKAALAKAITIRTESIAKYEAAATKSKRASARQLKNSIVAAPR